MNKATVLEIQRMSTEDGPGIRTTVFFKGCPLKCTWCHNPESISARPQLQWIENKCIGCKTCLNVCPKSALTLTDTGMIINREKCDGCGRCAEECPSTALELLGTNWTLLDLVNEVIKDRAYFEKSGGGITVSGGEPTMQLDFVAAFLQTLKEKDIHTALDTCGQCSPQALDRLLPYADLVLYDIKEIDPGKHKIFTGATNKKILENIVHIAGCMRQHQHPKDLWIRTPIIPDATATQDNIRGIGEFISRQLSDVISRWELCSFNNLCKDKYLRLDRKWQYHDNELLTKDFMENMSEVARESGINPAIVHWSGSTKFEEQPDKESKKRADLQLVKGCSTA